FASASDIDGTKAIDKELVIKVGRNNNGITYPVNSPYCFVANVLEIPAIAKLCATNIGSKKLVNEPIIRLPVLGRAIENNSFKVSLLDFKWEKKRYLILIFFVRLNRKIIYNNEANSPRITLNIAPPAAYSTPSGSSNLMKNATHVIRTTCSMTRE